MSEAAELDRWCILENELIQDFDGNDIMFNEVKNLSKYQLGPLSSSVKNGRQYFDVLRNNLGSDDLLDFLINLMNYSGFHQDLYFGGNRIADTLRSHKDKLIEYKRECMKKDIYDENFVGRKEELDELINILSEENSKYRGLSICGLGGIGKTSLANEICRRLWASHKHWRVLKIDIRERKTLLDLIRDTLLKLHSPIGSEMPQDQQRSGFMEEDLKRQLFDLITKKHYIGSVLLLDNCDDVLEKEEEKFITFTRDLLQIMKRCQKCKFRIIITSRQKLIWGEHRKNFKDVTADFQELLFEKEVKELKLEDAVTLFKQCTRNYPASDQECEQIVNLCSRIPLAMRTVCSTLRCHESIKPVAMIRLLQTDKSMLGIDICLDQTFTRLNDRFQSALLQLCLFRTAEFNLEAAKDVLMDLDEDLDAEAKEEITELKTKFQLLHLKSRLLLEIHDQSIQNEDFPSKVDTLYSIHPLVYDFLQKKLKSDNHQTHPMLQRDLEKAKERFVIHYKKIIDKLSDSIESGGSVDLSLIMKDNRVHFLSFFDALTTVDLPKVRPQKKVYTDSRKLSDLISLCLVDNNGRKRKLLLLEKWIADAEREGNEQMSILRNSDKMLVLIELNEMRSEDFHTANCQVQCLEKRARTDNDFAVLGRYYYALARYNSHCGEKQAAKNNLEKSVIWYQKIKTKSKTFLSDLAEVYNSIGCYYFTQNSIAEAKRFHEKALDLCSNLDNNQDPKVRVYLSNIGSCWFNEGIQRNREVGDGRQEFEKALQHYSQAIDLDRHGNMSETETHMEKLINRGMVYVHLKEFEKAKEDVWLAADVRKNILPHNHPKQTLTEEKKADLMYRWSLEEDEGKKADKTIEAEYHYINTMEMIRRGGLDKDHADYQSVKERHLRFLKKMDEKEKLQQAEDFYRTFECEELDDEIQESWQPKGYFVNSQNDIRTHSDSSMSSEGDTDEDIDMLLSSTSGMQDFSAASNRSRYSATSLSDRSSGSLSSQISVPDFQKRPKRLSTQSSSVEDDPFGRPEKVKKLRRQSATVQFLSDLVCKGRDARRDSWLSSSAGSSSLSIDEEVLPSGCEISVNKYQRITSENLKQHQRSTVYMERDPEADDVQSMKRHISCETEDLELSDKKIKLQKSNNMHVSGEPEDLESSKKRMKLERSDSIHVSGEPEDLEPSRKMKLERSDSVHVSGEPEDLEPSKKMKLERSDSVHVSGESEDLETSRKMKLERSDSVHVSGEPEDLEPSRKMKLERSDSVHVSGESEHLEPSKKMKLERSDSVHVSGEPEDLEPSKKMKPERSDSVHVSGEPEVMGPFKEDET